MFDLEVFYPNCETVEVRVAVGNLCEEGREETTVVFMVLVILFKEKGIVRLVSVVIVLLNLTVIGVTIGDHD